MEYILVLIGLDVRNVEPVEAQVRKRYKNGRIRVLVEDGEGSYITIIEPWQEVKGTSFEKK